MPSGLPRPVTGDALRVAHTGLGRARPVALRIWPNGKGMPGPRRTPTAAPSPRRPSWGPARSRHGRPPMAAFL
eukprot:427812-Lingulodinium_polyedra.AAC.1